LAGDCTPKALNPADKVAGRRFWPTRLTRTTQTGSHVHRTQLSNSGCQICDVVQEKPLRGGRRVLKNGGADPIQTLNVVTGPPEVGEVNTSNRA
jgi:hypothetical protein